MTMLPVAAGNTDIQRAAAGLKYFFEPEYVGNHVRWAMKNNQKKK